MTTPTLDISIDSKNHQLPAQWLQHADDALGQGLRHVAEAWSEEAYTIIEQVKAQGFHILLVDTLPEAAGALGYHDIDKAGKPFIRIGLDVIMNNGGDWLTGPMSVTSVIDHETKELVGDPAANIWANDAQGVVWARELCDAVEARTYDVTCADGTSVSLSDFLLPAYFNPAAPAGTQLDYVNVLAKPFSIDHQGYAIRMSPGKITQVFADDYPKGKLALKYRAIERKAWFPDFTVE